jgi:hypothetical protein
VAAAVLGGQRQLDQRGHRPRRAQQGVGQLEGRVGTSGQAVVEALAEPGQHGQRLAAGPAGDGRVGLVHTDHRSPCSDLLP